MSCFPGVEAGWQPVSSLPPAPPAPSLPPHYYPGHLLPFLPIMQGASTHHWAVPLLLMSLWREVGEMAQGPASIRSTLTTECPAFHWALPLHPILLPVYPPELAPALFSQPSPLLTAQGTKEKARSVLSRVAAVSHIPEPCHKASAGSNVLIV